MSLISNVSVSGMIKAIQIVLPPVFSQETATNIYKLFRGITSGFAIPTEQINDLYDKCFLSSATGTALDNIINDYSNERRKDSESDVDYRERYLKYVFTYNSSPSKISEIVYDISGSYPVKLITLNDRTGYWGEGNLPVSGQVNISPKYYNDIPEYAPLWSGTPNENKFTAYVYLEDRPLQGERNELCRIINMVHKQGTKIYLVYPNNSVALYDDEAIYDGIYLYS